MTHGLKTIIHPVRDLAATKALYTTLLGTPPIVDQPWYVGFDVAGQHVGLDPNGHAAGMTGPVGYWHVDDIRTSLDALLAAGAALHQETKDVGGGKLVAAVKDQDGNVIGLLQAA
jgi:predicted enzyme related to lactoylglutathione lyase